MKQIAAAKFKEQCLALLDRVGPEGIVITKHGRPVAKLVPIESGSEGLIGALRGKLTIRGDILSTGERWDAEP
jgi:prevent-host-death family protein